MLRHYIITAWRNLLRNRTYSIINLMGLAMGVACCLLIAMYVLHELNYNSFFPELEDVYLVAQETSDNPGTRWATTAPIMGEMLAQDIPEVNTILRLHKHGGLVSMAPEGGQLSHHQLDEITYVDDNFFSFTGLPLLQGDPEKALSAPNQVVIPQTLAQQLFGTSNPIGQMLRVDSVHQFQVSGIMADVPTNSSLTFDMLVSWPTLNVVYGGANITESWWWPPTQVLVRLHPGADVSALNQTRLPAFVQQYREPSNTIMPSFQPLADVHLYGISDDQDGAIRYVSLFAVVALVILLIACINFTNLATARAASRAREVGVRKVVGAGRLNLLRQFLGESFLMTAIASMLGLGLAELFMPMFNQLAGISLSIPWDDGRLWLSLLALIIGLGLLAGSYPALVLSSFRPIQVLKATIALQVKGGYLRQSLVVSQFIIGITLMISTLVIWQQHRYMLNQELGFDKSQLVNLSVKDAKSRYRVDLLLQELEHIPGVEQVAPTSWAGISNYIIRFPVEVEGANGEMQAIDNSDIVYSAPEWLATIGAELIEGRDFSEEMQTDAEQAFLVNEQMVKKMQDSSLIGRQARLYYSEYGQVLYEKKGRIVGTFQDFHMRSLRSPISPTIVAIATGSEVGNYLGNIAIRLHPGDHQGQIQQIQTAWERVFPQKPFDFVFVDDAVQEAYQSEAQLGRILTAFTLLAILIALLGLLGLTAFTAQKRTKEIGVRKILGANRGDILLLLNREFSVLVGISLLIAAPLAYWLTQGWLEDYPYRISFSVLPYFAAGFGALLLTWLTVSIHAIRAAWRNPADALRYE